LVNRVSIWRNDLEYTQYLVENYDLRSVAYLYSAFAYRIAVYGYIKEIALSTYDGFEILEYTEKKYALCVLARKTLRNMLIVLRKNKPIKKNDQLVMTKK